MSEKLPVLIVDDDPDDRLALKATLEPLGLDLVQAEDGEEALRQLLSRDFALVIMDLMMPRLNGFETASLIRRREKHRAMPIIILTGFDSDGARTLPGYRDDLECMGKPVPADALRARVLQCLGRASD